MAKILDLAVEKGDTIQVSVTTLIPQSSVFAVRILDVPENNIRLLASVYIYRNYSTSEAGEFFAYELGIVRQRRTLLYLPRGIPGGDILRVIPLYDFDSFEMWLLPP